MGKEDYIEDFYKRKATERLLQELIEAAIDINVHLIMEAGHTPPDDYYESFVKMGELGIISSDLADKLAPSAGLRNRLVHEYDMLDHTVVLKAVATAEEMFSKYVKEINDYLYVQRINSQSFFVGPFVKDEIRNLLITIRAS